MARRFRSVGVFIGYPASSPRPPVIPPGASIDTTEDEGGILGYIDSEFFTLDQSVVAVGFRFVTTSGTFTTIGSGEEDPVADLKFSLFKVFDNGDEDESMFSTSPVVDISSGTWSGTAGSRLDRATLLTPGKYRLDFSVSLTEEYEFDTIADIDTTIVVLTFDLFSFNKTDPDNVYSYETYVGLRMFTRYNLETGVSSITPYAWDEDTDDVPVAVDVTTTPQDNMTDWCARLLAKVLDVDALAIRSYLDSAGYIDNSLNAGGWARAVTNMNIRLGTNAGGGAFTEQLTVKAALMRVLFECRHALDWTSWKARLIFIPAAKNEGISPQRTIYLDDIERVSIEDPIPKLSVSWTGDEDVINTIDARYDRDYSLSGGSREAYLSAIDREEITESVTEIGRQFDEEKFLFDWVVTQGHAESTAAAWREYFGEPKKIVEFEGFLNLLELQRGDIINFELTPTITIGETGNAPDANQGWGEGGWGSAGWGGNELSPPGTIKGEFFDSLTTADWFMVEQMQVNWDTKRIRIRCREMP